MKIMSGWCHIEMKGNYVNEIKYRDFDKHIIEALSVVAGTTERPCHQQEPVS